MNAPFKLHILYIHDSRLSTCSEDVFIEGILFAALYPIIEIDKITVCIHKVLNNFVLSYSDNKEKEENTLTVGQSSPAKLPRRKTNKDLLLGPPMVLMIQTELCEKKTLKNWLSDHIHDRKRKTVINFFEQVHISNLIKR